MKANTHQRAGLCVGLWTHPFFIGTIYENSNAFSQVFIVSLFCTAAIIGSLLPDIDMPGSHLGNFFPVFSRFLSRVFRHRTLTHSLLSILGFVVLLSYAGHLSFGYEFFTVIVVGLMAGHISHILLDMLTPAGVLFFYPFPFKVSLGKIKTGSWPEKLVSRFFMTAAILYFAYLYYQLAPMF